MKSAHYLLAVFTLGSGGCFLDPGACQDEHRTLELAGTIVTSGSGTQTIGAAVSLNESTGNPGFRVLNLVLTTALNGEIASASLLDVAAGGTQVLATWPSGNIQLTSRWDANLELASSPPTHETLAQLAGAGRLQLRVEFEAASGLTSAAGPLRVTTDGSWEHLRCD